MDALDADWDPLLTTFAAAAAALAGLLIVALSVNVQAIVAIRGMTSRAATSVAALVLILVVSCVGLVPGVPLVVLGAVTVVAGGVVLIVGIHSARLLLHAPSPPPRPQVVAKGMLGYAPAAVVLAGGALLCLRLDAGLYVLTAGVLAIFVASIANAWVLLVEILR